MNFFISSLQQTIHEKITADLQVSKEEGVVEERVTNGRFDLI